MGEWRILTHGGAGSAPELSSATDEAAERAREELADGASAIAAACRAVASLEADGRFNAGGGSYVRADGNTVQMDAACADSTGRFGAVACVEGLDHPIHAARAVTHTENLVLAGEGARTFALEQGVGKAQPGPSPGERGSSHDTVGCVVSDGSTFAAALSSGGTEDAIVGRVGDVPLPGCGLRAGPAGAVAATGHGESIARRRTADRAYRALAEGMAPSDVVDRELDALDGVPIGLIVVGPDAGAGGASGSMACSQRLG